MDALEFLRKFHPSGYWVLTAIRADRKGIEVRTFTPAEADEVLPWVQRFNSTNHNIYFSVNQPRGPVTKKTNREDIATVHYLHVDIDARAGEPLEDELVRIRTLLHEKNPTHEPTCIVFSGGGYQAFWRLAEPIVVDGKLEAAEDAARYNRQLEILFGGDSCSNIDRIMRLPGTVNIPNAKKAERGRLPVQAEVDTFSDLTYELRVFTQAPRLQSGGVDSNTFTPSANVDRLGNIDDLNKYKVPDRVKVVIVQGFDPDAPKKDDNSRSAWLFDVCCQLLRLGVPEDVVFAVITDPDFGISSSVLDKGSNYDKYAVRQIQRAKEEVEEPWLRELNDKHIVIGNMGGRCRVMEECFDPAMNRHRLTYQTFTDFRNRYSNATVQVGKRMVQVGQWWLGHPRRRQADALVFTPGRSVPGTYNLWQGFSCHAVPGKAHESFLEHIRDNICNGNEGHYKYLLGWMARTVQQPDRIGETAVVLRGRSGTGKSFFAQQFGSLFGRHYLQVSDAKHLVGTFNMHLKDCVLLFGDEAFYVGDRRHESVLKTLITSREINIEGKGLDVDPQPNFIHLLLASNAEWVVPSGPMERRFFVLDVGDDHQQDNPYFERMDRDMNAGGREALLHFLLSYDLSEFNVYRVPHTQALLEQKLHSLEPMHEWWFSGLLNGSLLQNSTTYQEVIPVTLLVDDYVAYCIRFNIVRRGNSIRLGHFLHKVCPEGFPERARAQGGQYTYRFPALQALRTCWDDLMGTQTDWPEEGPVKEVF